MHINGSSDWRRVLPLRVRREPRAWWLRTVGLPAATCLVALAAMLPLVADGITSIPRLLLVVLASVALGAVLRSCWQGPDAWTAAGERNAHPAATAALRRLSAALDEGLSQHDLLGAIARGALEITRGAICVLTLSDGTRTRVDRPGVGQPGPNPERGAAIGGIPAQRTPPALRAQLVALGEILGTLEVWPRSGQRLGNQEDELLRFFSSESAVALKNAVLLSHARARASTLQSKISEMEWWQTQLDTYASDLARTHEELHQARSILDETYMATLEALAAAVDARDPYTYGHCRRVAELASVVALEMGLPEQDRRTLECAALLHDIGKIGVPDTTLRKTTPLTEEDWAAIRHHPELGFRMLSALRFLGDALPAIRYHHERFDGTGYPYQLAGDQIPLIARVLAVADAYDAITSDRPYRPGRSKSQGLAEVVRCVGTHFDPAVANALLRALQPPDHPSASMARLAPLAV